MLTFLKQAKTSVSLMIYLLIYVECLPRAASLSNSWTVINERPAKEVPIVFFSF